MIGTSSKASLADGHREEALKEILRVSTSAGGARAKAIIAWNPTTHEVRSGQIDAGEGFEYWLLKFDGVENNKDKDLADPKGFGAIEYAYYLMAKEAGITMSESRLLRERTSPFHDKAFRSSSGRRKIHMQSFGAMMHYDYNMPGANSYEQAILTMRMLDLPMDLSKSNIGEQSSMSWPATKTTT